MSTSYVDEYLIKLGSVVDQSGMQRFNQALREATNVAATSAASIAGAMFKAQTEIVAGFAAIGSATLGLVDKVAMADQSYRLLALHMHMSKDAARSLKVAMDALGEPLENLTWDIDPKTGKHGELYYRTQQLIKDQRAMAPNGDFDAQMRKVRDIRFEFTRMEVEGQYLAMHVVNDFMKALGLGPDELLGKLQKFNEWVIHDLPQISDKMVKLFLPVWKDVRDVAVSTWEAMKAVGLAFTNVVGALSGDQSIEGTTFDLEKMAGAIQHVAHWFAIFAQVVNGLVEGVADLTAGLALLFSKIPAPLLGAIAGAAVGGFTGGPLGALAGAAIGGVTGLATSSHADGSGSTASASAPASISALIDKYANIQGIDPRIAHAIAMRESGEHQFSSNGSLVKNPGSSATGVFQLLDGTARTLGVNSSDTEDNVKGGTALFAQLLKHYGDVPTALVAYHEGESKTNAILAGKATLSSDARTEMASVMRKIGGHGDVHIGSIVVNVDKPNAVNADVHKSLASAIRGAQDKRVQRNLAEFQDAAWSY